MYLEGPGAGEMPLRHKIFLCSLGELSVGLPKHTGRSYYGCLREVLIIS